VDARRKSRLGFILVAVLLAEVSAILVYSAGRTAPAPVVTPGAALGITGNTETVGMLLYTDYLVPFEVASVLLLVAMIGAIILAKKEL
jgi:NADH-quinone oxidoreductase subunit J